MFKSAVNNTSSTENGALSHKSTLNPVLDFFFMCGSLRGKDFEEYKSSFKAALKCDRKLTLQMLLWLRDVREGAGERDTVRNLLKYLEVVDKTSLKKIIPVLAEFGRWDDLLIFNTPEIKELAFSTIASALDSGNALCAKWMPREYSMKKTNGKIDYKSTANKNRTANNKNAKELREYLKLSPKQYRKLLSQLSSTVEQKMCDKKFSEIDFSTVPSVASLKYKNAFMRNAEEEYLNYLESLSKGESKVNAGAVYPYNIVNAIGKDTNGTEQLLISQWESLKNYMNDNSAIPMVDMSGSMFVSAGNTSYKCIDVAISLGLYIADKQQGAFKDLFLNFSDDCNLYCLEGTNIIEKYNSMMKYSDEWGGSTNIESAFKQILNVAVQNNIPESEMPKYLIVLSDMEFNPSYTCGYNVTVFNKMKAQFKSKGYELPGIVFWNLNAREGNNPVKMTDTNVAMVSGFSPTLMSSVLEGDFTDPVKNMLKVIDVPRYQVL